MPRRVVRELLEQVLAIPLSLGSIQNSWEEASEAVAEPCAELEKQLPHEPVVNSDETGYRTSGEKRWLWALVAANFVFYKIAASRAEPKCWWSCSVKYSPAFFAATAVPVT